jgi:hypothetical protein
MQRLSTTAMLAVLSSIGIHAHAQDVAWAPPVATDYVVKQIPGMHYVFAINDSGVAVGGADGNSVAVAFANGQLIRLPATGFTRTLAYAISNAGSIVGFGSTATSSYGLFWPSLTSEPIRITGPNGSTMRPVAVNSQGVVVGWGDASRAARWTAATGMTFMDPLGSIGAEPWDLSETGYVAGTIRFSETQRAIGRWNPNGTSGVVDWNGFAWRVRDDGGVIGSAEGGSYLWSVSNTRTPLASYAVRDMSSTGRIVGRDNVSEALTQATPNGPVQALPRLPNGGGGFAIDVNACGTIVGMMSPLNDYQRPVMWSRASCDVQTTASVPDVRALTLDQAALTLKASNVFAGRTNYIVGPCPDVNRIVGQSPAAGVQAPTASSVELTVVVSCSVAVPDLRGQAVSGARATLHSVGLDLGTTRNATDTSCNYIGTVMSHSPTAGVQANWGSAVNVTVGQRPKTPCP